jgi:asparagine synthase (glutamine-hydrolysing)
VSKLCGVCYLDSRSVSQEDGARVRAALGTRGYVAPQEHRDSGLLMGWAAGCEASRGRGQFQSPDRSSCSWDGRLDNRKDLLPLTDLPADCPDSAIVLSLYQQKGLDGLRDVVGDWSLCVWDANRRTIVLASDYAGIRPLYYHRSVDALYWSSSLADLVRWTGITELDDVYAGSFLARGSAPARTPYAGIFAVPPGHAVSISQDGIAKRAFWNLPIHQEIRYQDERSYEERLLELFRESVRGRIATDRPICAELSGGLDSSSVVSMADRLRKEAPGLVQRLHTFSYTHDRCPDERYFREVERACNLPGCHLQLQEYPAVAADMGGRLRYGGSRGFENWRATWRPWGQACF